MRVVDVMVVSTPRKFALDTRHGIYPGTLRHRGNRIHQALNLDYDRGGSW
jgi:hypothetical protein